jgi:plasmid stabilization system protein ParE
MNITILESAQEDLLRGFWFYEEQEPGIGSYFFDTLTSEINSLANLAGIHPTRLGYHRMLSARFPFAIYYKVEANEAVIRAVLDCRQDPDTIKDRLR